MATLSFKKINKIYPNGVQAVFDFNLEVLDKEFIVFVGPSGCGKSTTLRMIAGLEEISAGQLYINGLMVNNVEPKDRNIAMVFQSYALYPHMTVFNNMSFSLKLRKIKFPVYEENAEAEELLQENLQLFKEVGKLNKIIRKNNEPLEVVAQREEILSRIYANEEKRKQILVQLTGISQVEISDCEKQIKKIQKDIQESIKTIEKCEKDIIKMEAKRERYHEDDLESLEKVIKQLVDIRDLTKEGLEQKHVQLQKVMDELEYYKNNEVPLYTYRKHTKYEINVEVYKTAKILDLSRYLFRKPAALSGGQRQRVALGRAIVRHPQVFLMDEPLSNLDAKLRVQMRNDISKIHEAVGATTVYVTHDQTEAMTMATRIVVMKDGYIQQIGEPKEVYSDPSNMFVAGFIGSPAMNFFKGRLEKGKFVFDSEDEKQLSLKLEKKHLNTLKDYEGKEIVLGIRPESIYLDGDVNNQNPTDAFDLKCDFAELLGYELVIYTFVAGQKLVFKTSIKNDVKTHQDIKVAFNSDALYFFDAETTLRIK